jgi:hypothetical protein
MAHQESYASQNHRGKASPGVCGPQDSIPTSFDDTSLIRKALAADRTVLKGNSKRSIHNGREAGNIKGGSGAIKDRLCIRETSPDNQEYQTLLVVDTKDKPMILEAPVVVDASPSTNHTDDMKDLIRRTMMVGDTEVIRNVPGSQVNGSDIRTLADGEQLNDSVVEAYFKMIGARSGRNGFLSAHVFDTFFYSKLAAQGFMDVRDWSRGADIFGHDLIIFPVYTTGHWRQAEPFSVS